MKKAAVISQTPERREMNATKRLVVLALLSALGFISMMIVKIPVIWILKYEPKDIFITLGGFLYGPLAALACSVVTALLELPFSETNLIGMVMNILSSAAFSCTAALIYKKRRDLYGALIGLVCGVAVMTATMLFWNYLITPLYNNVPRAQVVPMLTTVFLPFNLLKSGINAVLVMLLYRPFRMILTRLGWASEEPDINSKGARIAVYVTAVILLIVCVCVVIWLNTNR